MKHKQEIHEEVDHPGLNEIRDVFDMRLWDFEIIEELLPLTRYRIFLLRMKI